MYHLLDDSQSELEGFTPFGPRPEEEGKATTTAAGGTLAKVERMAVEKGFGSSASAAQPKSKGKGGGAATKGKGGGGDARGSGEGDAVKDGLGKEEMRRLGLYAAFLLPLSDSKCANSKGANVRALLLCAYRGNVTCRKGVYDNPLLLYFVCCGCWAVLLLVFFGVTGF